MNTGANGILVFLDRDLNTAQPALKKGLAVARAAALPLTVAVNADSPAMRRALAMDQQRRDGAEGRLRHAWRRRIEELIGDDNDAPDVTQRISLDRDAEEDLRRTVMDVKPALTVIHTSDSGPLRRHLFTPRDWMLIRHAPGAVLCVHDRPWSTPPRFTLAIEPESEAGDGRKERAEGALDTAILRAGRRWAAPFSADLEAVHVMEFPDETLIMAAGETLPEYTRNAQGIRSHHRQALEGFAHRHGLGNDHIHLLEGPIAKTLAHHCEQQGRDWLIVGTVRRTVFERLLLGATAEALLTCAGNDVLVVKPEHFVSDWEKP